MMQRALTWCIPILLITVAILLQIPALHQMALKQSSPIFHSLLPYYNSFKPASASFLSFLHINNTRLPHQAERHFATSPSINMADTDKFLETTLHRRTTYQLKNESTIPDSRIQELVAHTIKHVPSSFNSQSTRLVVVLKKEHVKLWDAIAEVYKVALPADKFEQAKGRFDMFRAAYGTVRSPALCW